ncbi:hypothetical protein C6N75_09925 [Streptomyces solincola]|uniref:Uncharacterized protein n=1 Tax=Streptomyces solincola TaxID=2100817 RepID=A0A2S9PY94_9ACTN|nr:hypothetical protein [Streptomyces solincola]PRH79391.1 hypothetical protein C6N75_09925 [Streptomyces solincola]
MAISYVSRAGWYETVNDSSYQLTKPANVQSGDLLIAALVFYSGDFGSAQTVNTPSGWTKVRDITMSSSYDYPSQMTIFKRTAGSSEPTSWSGTLGGSEIPKASVVVAYRGVETAANQFVAEAGAASAAEATSLNTATVNNNDSDAWRVVIGNYVSASDSYALTCTEVTERGNLHFDDETGGYYTLWLANFDSNGAVATGNHSRSIGRQFAWASATAWIALLKPSDPIPPSSGSFAAELPDLLGTITANANHPATLSGTLPAPTAAFAGYPHEPATGSLAAGLPGLTAALAGIAPALGALEATLPGLTADVRADTRPHGPRVHSVEPERRIEYMTRIRESR